LAEIVENSMGDYPISAEMGAWFILTGEFVPEYPVRMRYMTVRQPWVMSRNTSTLEVERAGCLLKKSLNSTATPSKRSLARHLVR
jgi:hypothetical protein